MKSHITWFDNFSRFVPRRQPTLSRPLYDNNNWTVEGIIPIPEALAHIDVKATGDVMPHDLFAPDLLDLVAKDYHDRLSLSSRRFDSSTSKATKLLPVRPADYLELKKHNLLAPRAEFIPCKFRAEEIGSNVGLRDLLLHYEHERGDAQWSMLLLDSNVYKRVLKVPPINLEIKMTDRQDKQTKRN